MSPPTRTTIDPRRRLEPGAGPDQRTLEGDRVVDDPDVVGHGRASRRARRRPRSRSRAAGRRRWRGRAAAGHRSARPACRARTGSTGRRRGSRLRRAGRSRRARPGHVTVGRPAQDRAAVEVGEDRHDVLAARSRRVAQCGRRQRRRAGHREGRRGDLAVGRSRRRRGRARAGRSGRSAPARGRRPAGRRSREQPRPGRVAPGRREPVRGDPSRRPGPDPGSRRPARTPGGRTPRPVALEAAVADEAVDDGRGDGFGGRPADGRPAPEGARGGRAGVGECRPAVPARRPRGPPMPRPRAGPGRRRRDVGTAGPRVDDAVEVEPRRPRRPSSSPGVDGGREPSDSLGRLAPARDPARRRRRRGRARPTIRAAPPVRRSTSRSPARDRDRGRQPEDRRGRAVGQVEGIAPAPTDGGVDGRRAEMEPRAGPVRQRRRQADEEPVARHDRGVVGQDETRDAGRRRRCRRG